MSRTRRRLPFGKSNSVKRYKSRFSPGDTHYIGRRPPKAPPPGLINLDEDTDIEGIEGIVEAYTIWDIHHWVFRNGSCYRQRINGVRKTKQQKHRRDRRRLKRTLRQELESVVGPCDPHVNGVAEINEIDRHSLEMTIDPDFVDFIAENSE